MLQNFKAYQLSKELYQECSGLKAKAYMKDQLERASLSIVLNLAEGSAKTSPKDRKRFYETALGSAREVQVLVELLKADKAISLSDQAGACIFALVRSLQ